MMGGADACWRMRLSRRHPLLRIATIVGSGTRRNDAMNRRTLFFGAAGAALLAEATVRTTSVQPSDAVRVPEPRRPLRQDGPEWFTNVAVQVQDGRTLRFYD